MSEEDFWGLTLRKFNILVEAFSHLEGGNLKKDVSDAQFFGRMGGVKKK